MKKNNQILIGSTSFLLPKSNSWNQLKNLYLINFSEYSNVDSVLNDKNNYNYKILVIFFEDLIDNSKGIKKKLNFLLSNIEKSLISHTSQLIICYGDYHSKEIIRNTKDVDNLTNISNQFKKRLYLLSKKNKNLSIIDLDIVFRIHGYINIIDKRNWYLAHCRLSETGLSLLVDQIKKVLFSMNNATSKVLVLDCDNTLWGGVVGEDGTYGIKIGSDGEGLIFQDFQKEILNLKKQGVILAISSKNNEKDVWEVFNKNTQMCLSKKDISSFKINWKEKYLNIKEISKDLNLALNSFVFWDDNPIEREKVKRALPEVKVINVPKETYDWIDLLKNNEAFAKSRISEEDKKRTKQYLSITKFNEDKKNINDDNFLKSISLKPKIFVPDKSNIVRFSQMTMKTNQFNFRTIRMTETEVESKLKSNNEFFFMCKAKDIYGDHGIIGLATLNKLTKDTFYLSNYLMSCRVLGRKLENWFIENIFLKLKNRNINKLVIGFMTSDKNKVAQIFLKSLKLEKFSDKKISKYLELRKHERLYVKNLANFKYTGNKYYE